MSCETGESCKSTEERMIPSYAPIQLPVHSLLGVGRLWQGVPEVSIHLATSDKEHGRMRVAQPPFKPGADFRKVGEEVHCFVAKCFHIRKVEEIYHIYAKDVSRNVRNSAMEVLGEVIYGLGQGNVPDTLLNHFLSMGQQPMNEHELAVMCAFSFPGMTLSFERLSCYCL